MAITTLTPTKLGVGRETVVKFATGVTIATSAPLDTLFDSGTGHNVTALAKNVTIAPPETAHELQSFLGADTNSFQNQLLEEKPPGIATATATLILDENEVLEPYLDGTGSAITGGYTRYQLGNSQSAATDVLITISGSSGAVNMALIDAEVTKWGDVRISGPDSHWEQDVQMTCLSKNFYWEYKN